MRQVLSNDAHAGRRSPFQEDTKDGAYMATLKQKFATEIGDTFIYLDLLATFYELSMERCVVDTFNRVSEREGFPDKING